MRYLREDIVHAPAARVWELLVDVEGWPAWTESMREIRRVAGSAPTSRWRAWV